MKILTFLVVGVLAMLLTPFLTLVALIMFAPVALGDGDTDSVGGV